jgi:hypothetical protein
LSFGTDAWTSPNHKAYVAVTVHLEQDAQPLSFLLDLMDVPRSHTGVNLAKSFADILYDFEIEEKVGTVKKDEKNIRLPCNPLDPRRYV